MSIKKVLGRNKVLKRLIDYAKRKGIDVHLVYFDTMSSCYNHICNVIFLGMSGNRKHIIPTLAHEIGHAEQLLSSSARRFKYYCRIYNLLVSKGIMTWNLLMIELGAWKRAKRILSEINYNKWKDFNKLRRDSIKSYFKRYYE